jgi:ornithine carbamoyltransferase
MALPFTIIKRASEGKQRFMETQIFQHAKIYIIFKKSSKRNQKSFQILL